MEELSKTQLVLLVLLVSFVTSVATALVTATLIEQAPKPITETIYRVLERNVSSDNEEEDQIVETIIEVNETTLVVSEEERITDIAETAGSAVVSVIATKDVPLLTQCFTTPFGNDDIFAELFPELRVPGICEQGTEERQVSAGSGFFVDSSGIIATNRHVVADKDADYSVILNNGSTLPASVIARDPFHDLAVLEVEGEGYTALELGNSDTLQIGRTVIAIGNALGEFQNTLSVGVISGLSRTISTVGAGSVEELRSLIQTDAAINPGNSGGPLITLDGKVIGINTAIARGAENIGFSLPINLLKKDLEDIEKVGRIVYPFLGIRYITLTEDIALEQELSVSHGALLVGNNSGPAVVPGSPADEVGLLSGDVILEIEGEKVTSENPLAVIIQKYRPEDEITLKVLRSSGEETDLTLTLTEFKQ